MGRIEELKFIISSLRKEIGALGSSVSQINSNNDQRGVEDLIKKSVALKRYLIEYKQLLGL